MVEWNSVVVNFKISKLQDSFDMMDLISDLISFSGLELYSVAARQYMYNFTCQPTRYPFLEGLSIVNVWYIA